jgi:hypothetical protein
MEYQLMRATDKIVHLESKVARLEIENKSLKQRIEEMVTVEQLDAQRKMNSICERRELSLLNAKRKYERQNGVVPTCARRLSFSEVIGCSGGYDEIDG